MWVDRLPSDERIINITISNYENFNIKLTVNMLHNKVIDLKRKIVRIFAFPAEHSDLWHMNKKMEDYKMLYQYYLNEGCEVKMTRVGYDS
ncbi:hypothetical protein Dsin_031632 [Dipteronia sinensis]|uniref:Ubiquitin-like domain-containing protein n=1 Tax=Dipteronia sinensis TaxID=43782 RepID=A0AAD9ZLR2_9ROSI|nr:hypothetical protein Dsin_031632 [Dipteronia sinensis]